MIVDQEENVTIKEFKQLIQSDLWYDWFSHVAEFNVIALRALREKGQGYPPQFETMDEWHAVLDKMIAGFDMLDITIGMPLDSEERTAADEGLALYAKHFMHLWD